MLSTYAQAVMVNALPIPAAIFTGPEHLISAVNSQMLTIWSKEPEVIGKNLLDAIPELRDQGFFELLTDVYTSGKEYHNPHGKAELMVEGELRTKYFDFSFKPLQDSEGNIYGVINTALDTTERILSERQLQLVNDNLGALNEELKTSGEKLKTAYDHLNNTYNTLNIANQKAELLLKGAPVAVGVIDAITFKIDTANTKLLELWGLSQESIGSLLEDVLPQPESEFLVSLITQIRNSGQTLYGDDIKTLIEREAVWVATYFNFVYQPIKNLYGEVISVQVVANEVTDQRNAKINVDAALTQLNLAKKAANFGVFDLDVINDRLY